MRKQTKMWKTKDNRKIRICDMADDHLSNTISFLRRYAENMRKYEINALASAIPPSGDMAQLAFDRLECEVFSSTIDDYLPDIFYNLQLEQLRRNQ